MDDVQTRVQTLIDRLVERGDERGLQVAAYLDGQLVVDACAGVADAATGRPVSGDTLFTVWSIGKGVTATVLHLLAERGRLAYDVPIARYWPEFAAHGKHAITLRHVLTHTSGIPLVPEGITPSDLLDWETMCRRVAELEPLWPPGTKMAYHAMTYGWLTGEVARRVDGRPFAEIVQGEICAPLGVDSLFFGIPDAVEPRVAMLEEEPAPTPADPPTNSLGERTTPPWRKPISAWANRPEVRRACVPSSGGIANARALARHYAALVGDGVDGVRLLSPERVRIATALEIEDTDLVIGERVPRGLGYHLGAPLSSMGQRVSAFGHAGAGGSIAFADPAYRFAFALLKNRLREQPPGEDTAGLVAHETRAALGIPEG